MESHAALHLQLQREQIAGVEIDKPNFIISTYTTFSPLFEPTRMPRVDEMISTVAPQLAQQGFFNVVESRNEMLIFSPNSLLAENQNPSRKARYVIF
jgi:hypothetical protein